MQKKKSHCYKHCSNVHKRVFFTYISEVQSPFRKDVQIGKGLIQQRFGRNDRIKLYINFCSHASDNFQQLFAKIKRINLSFQQAIFLFIIGP